MPHIEERTVLYYSSVKEVIFYTGVRFDDFSLENKQELIDLLGEWLIEAKDYIDTYISRNLQKELEIGKITNIPPRIHDIATRIVANKVAQAVARRTTPLATKDSVPTITLSDNIFTDSIKQDLDQFIVNTSKPTLRISRARSKTERNVW
ncbi:hypothetical protein [Cytobacillus sp. NCCP-133]|uniref:hypothetical protein n=1 Tax=Cytobacillus sp. NCCP-133 TaxID=766848 RepID=UPI0022323C3E|nr:hypothetical protein [Cytobacillus sp. NCCP-133]GLB58673.1 hypothetical protein NCCP133_08060 [Cytobacillus sp. NCCP-133]